MVYRNLYHIYPNVYLYPLNFLYIIYPDKNYAKISNMAQPILFIYKSPTIVFKTIATK